MQLRERTRRTCFQHNWNPSATHLPSARCPKLIAFRSRHLQLSQLRSIKNPPFAQEFRGLENLNTPLSTSTFRGASPTHRRINERFQFTHPLGTAQQLISKVKELDTSLPFSTLVESFSSRSDSGTKSRPSLPSSNSPIERKPLPLIGSQPNGAKVTIIRGIKHLLRSFSPAICFRRRQGSARRQR